ncbi:MAG: DsbC family protein [Candidatus Porifericomitaceae bacterium WSBS_2022_MAG_OTU9]
MNKLVLVILSFMAMPLFAAAAGVSPEVERVIRQKIEGALSGISVNRVEKSPVPGLYQVQVGIDVIYITGDGHYLLRGDLLDLEKKVNQSDVLRKNLRGQEFSFIPEDEYIEFAPDGGGRHTLYVFTDVRCSYCRRLHNNMQEMNRLGITVRYLAFPVIGEQKEALAIMEKVWCAADRKDALTRAKGGDVNLVSAKCKNPVQKQFQLGRDMGVNGTPAMYMEDGTELPGYMEPGQILQQFRSS